ncbi:MAG: hypothetical protein IPJ84_21170 [Bdellovibrionales bacterium]|jgi:hypothetical protein|nr:hypothetical protein [Bdellovibrionales bacterium]
MKPSTRSSFKLGQEITGQVLEVLDTREVILRVFVTGSPELIRVANESNHPLARGSRVRLRVTALEPIQFQYVDDVETQRRLGHIDISI